MRMRTYPMIGIIGVHWIGNRVVSMHSGKDVFAELFIEGMNRHGIRYKRRAMADAVKEDVAKWLGVTVDYINANKDNFRLILQGYGTDYRRNLYGPDYWVKRFDSFVQEAQCHLPFDQCSFVVPDIRFANEVDYIRRQGGLVVRVSRYSGPDYPLDSRMLNHSSETEACMLPFDLELNNTSDLAAFRKDCTAMTENFLFDYERGKHDEFIAQRKAVSGR